MKKPIREKRKQSILGKTKTRGKTPRVFSRFKNLPPLKPLSDDYPALKEYDEAYEVFLAEENLIKPEDVLIRQLQDFHKASLPEDKKQEWEKYAFDESQQSREEAEKAVKEYLKRQLVVVREDYEKSDQKLLKMIKECPTYMTKAMTKQQTKWIALRAHYDCLLWEVKNAPIFHPRDSIVAIQVAEKRNRYNSIGAV